MSESSVNESTWTIGRLLVWTTDYFRGHQVEACRLDAEILLAHALHLERIQLYTRYDQPLMPHERTGFRDLVKRRAQGEPVAYLTGKREFYRIELKCDSRALIPRPETELLVDVVLERLPEGTKTIVDIGTGTGAIGLALASENSTFNVLMTDISRDALDLAKSNVLSLGLETRIGLLEGDLLDAISPNRQFEVCVSNPPYISDNTRDQMDRDVVLFEPSLALYGGSDGLNIIKRLVFQASHRLPPKGLLALEIGFDQEKAVVQLMQKHGFQDIKVSQDLAGHPRVVSAIK